MKKSIVQCDQCKKEFDADQLPSTVEDKCRLKFVLSNMVKDGAVYKFDLCSAKCLEEKVKTLE